MAREAGRSAALYVNERKAGRDQMRPLPSMEWTRFIEDLYSGIRAELKPFSNSWLIKRENGVVTPNTTPGSRPLDSAWWPAHIHRGLESG
jgi:hypothetical protein